MNKAYYILIEMTWFLEYPLYISDDREKIERWLTERNYYYENEYEFYVSDEDNEIRYRVDEVEGL